MKFPKILMLMVVLLPCLTSAKDQTLGEFRRQFVNQQIVVKDVPYNARLCLEWNAAKQKPDRSYEAVDVFPHLPITYNSQTAFVIAIQLVPQQSTHAGTNAFGETTTEDDVVNPYMEVVVKFDDGVLGIVRGFPITLVPGKMELAATRQALKDQVESQLPSVIGRKLYAVGFSQLYKPTSTVEDITGHGLNELEARMSISDIPFLEPLTITTAKYISGIGIVLFKLSLPNGSEAIAYNSSRYFGMQGDGDFLSRISGSLLTSIPNLTAREVEAIKSKSLFRGMSAEAVGFALGLKDSENDWGRGGKQRIYFHGKLIVYINNADKVEDWQSFE